MGLDFLFILKAIILAVIEGLTEFIPVSSKCHMILVSSIIRFDNPKVFVNMFEVVIQLGAVLAVLVLYWKKIKDSVIEFFEYIFTKREKGKKGFFFVVNIFIGCIPMGIVGIVFDKQIKMLFNSKMVVIGLIVGGILLIVIENKFRINKKYSIRNIDSITPQQSIKVGFFQLLSVWPGMSRSASSIIGGWVSGFLTPVAVEFSLFLAIPAIICSSAKDLLEFDFSIMNITLWITLIVGFITAFTVSLVIIEKFIAYLKKRPMRVFAVYRVGIGIIFVILMLIGVKFNI